MTLVPGRTERRVFVDSSAYLALLDQRDEHHNEAIQILHALAEQRARQFTSNVVVMEAHALILSTGGIGVGQAFLRSTEASNTTVVRVRASDEERAREIIYRSPHPCGQSYIGGCRCQRLGLDHLWFFQTYHRVLNRAVWSSLTVSRILLGLLVATFASEGALGGRHR
jgi:uncharacterized protein with PIN domain